MSAPGLQASNPRFTAFSILRRIEKEGCYADQLMDRELTHGSLSGPDRGLFAELVFGVLRRRGTLDYLLSSLLDQPLQKLELSVLVLLRLGLYQLLCLDRIPHSAAVNETVNLARLIIPRASGLVNAVLRNYLRRKDTITFPDPIASPAASIAARHSHPIWLVEQWLGQVGPIETEQLAEASSRHPPLTLRTNTLRIERSELLQLFKDHAMTASPCRYSPLGVVLEGRHHVPALPGFGEGLFAIQDEASQIAGLLLDPQPGERVLDACAAPGGKATLLAQVMENRGEVLATDISHKKLPLIKGAAERLGITIITTRAVDLLQSEALPAPTFDRILLDAPCSGSGVIRRNPEAKWRLKPGDVQRLAATQARLLENTAHLLKQGGTLLYSTCSTAVEENEGVVRDFLSRHDAFVLEDVSRAFPDVQELFSPEGMFRAWPHRHGTDGFFAARLRKK